MTTQCCEKCRGGWSDIGNQYACLNLDCPCHQTHTMKEGWEERFESKFAWDMARMRHLTACKPDLYSFIRSEITKAQVEVLDEVDRELPRLGHGLETMHFIDGIRSRITNKQSEI